MQYQSAGQREGEMQIKEGKGGQSDGEEGEEELCAGCVQFRDYPSRGYGLRATRPPGAVAGYAENFDRQRASRARPLAFGRVRMTVVSDPAKALALAQELSVLLA
ncbi:hypothetical protein NQZ68_003622 [Dissostichus eleginoides]|nr:hypothetical protein NQZ68_003622 [Dissostichus eleginoides]